MPTLPALDLNLIQLFVTIVDAGTLSEAALRHGVTRSHVSRNLQKLERAFGAQLIRRSTRRLELTQQGSVLYEHGARMAREVESARHALQKLGSEPTGHVRLSIPTGLGELDTLRPLLVSFALRHPSLTLRVLFSNRVSDLISSEIDVALRVMSTPPQDYVARALGDVKWVLCAAPAYLAQFGQPAHPRDLVRLHFLGPPDPRPQVTLRLRRKDQLHEAKLAPRLQSEYFPFLAQAARAGAGVALLPAYVVHEDIAAGRLTPVLPAYQAMGPGEKLFILTTPTPYPSTAQRAVVDFLRTEVPALLRGLLE
ncbi:LysR family transcriptional regulator [Achromobacter insolitus]|uniref:HTH-type transcriptional regulator DmlR n=1 Tax=Achromobacter insolitus TaxID=217204 RepID=A0A6S7FB22_9BURK|nr:LysR family transcriptional regulator [Achromobacter insolitus]CAB3933483.1 HTH-type transcriptional regulator DmlR [Achromobacter insolitus]CAB3937405.1 HTH-type transcriptional regulator DmlR [Achromobacter insolitus]